MLFLVVVVWACTNLRHTFVGNLPVNLFDIAFCRLCNDYHGDGIGMALTQSDRLYHN